MEANVMSCRGGDVDREKKAKKDAQVADTDSVCMEGPVDVSTETDDSVLGDISDWEGGECFYYEHFYQ